MCEICGDVVYDDDIRRDTPPNPIFSVVCNGELDLLKQALENDDDPSYNINLLDDVKKCAPLHIACSYGKYDCVEFLLRNPNIDVFLKDGCGSTPLHSACDNGNMNILKLLFQSAQNHNKQRFKQVLNQPDSDGCTPLHHAVFRDPSDCEVVDYLLTSGAQPCPTEFGMFPSEMGAENVRQRLKPLEDKYMKNVALNVYADGIDEE